jgi:hypothetical protein
MSIVRARRVTAFGCALLFGGALLGVAQVRPDRPPAPPAGAPRSATQPAKKGLIVNTAAACAGYTLFAPLNSTTTYLVDLKGEVVHKWPSRYEPGQAVYLLEDGSLLRTAREPDNRHFGGGGIGGRVQRLAPDGSVQWEFVYADEKHCLHHDLRPLPNGHVLMIAWEKKSREDALAAGRDPEQIAGTEVWPDCIIEVEPQGARGGKIVWEWHIWDHLVQDFDKNKPNYGAVAEHPELIDLNFRESRPWETPEEIRRLRALGYVGGGEPDNGPNGANPPPPGPGGLDLRADWCHTNTVAYNTQLDQIALSVHNFNEIWIIDHSTTAAEAAGHSGGRQGRGGDLLYRWGNPRAYGAGEPKDQQLFAQHDVRWIPDGRPGAGHLTVFNNGTGRPDGAYSSVVEIVPPVDERGRYTRASGQPFGPAKPCWEYTAADRVEFFSAAISGAERLPNGNTLVCSGEQGRIFEIDRGGKTVWEYVNPFQEPPRPQANGTPPRPAGPPPPFPNGPTSRPRADRPPFPPGGGPPGPGGPPGGMPGGPGGPPGGGMFRATRLAPDHPGVRRLLASDPKPPPRP